MRGHTDNVIEEVQWSLSSGATRRPAVMVAMSSSTPRSRTQSSLSPRLDVLGPGGIGETSVALTILHDKRVVEYFADRPLFLPCEATVNADAVAGSLATMLSLEVGRDPLSEVVVHLNANPRTALVPNKLETVCLVEETKLRKAWNVS